MSKDIPRGPETSATRFLREHKISYRSHLYAYEEHGGTRVSAAQLNVDEHNVIKTLIMEDESHTPMIVLMHGDRTVSTKALARQIPCKHVGPCQPAVAQRHSGYLVGGTSPFGTRKTMPVYMEKTILSLDQIFINGGKRGYLVSITPQDLFKALSPKLVEVAI